jgi:hypothetical protein
VLGHAIINEVFTFADVIFRKYSGSEAFNEVLAQQLDKLLSIYWYVILVHWRQRMVEAVTQMKKRSSTKD